MDRLFDTVFVRPPGASYSSCVSTNPLKNSINVDSARKQHRGFVSILKRSGIKVIELSSLEQFPDSVYMQDPALLGSRSAIIGRFGEKTRRGEEEALVRELNSFRNEIGETKYVRSPGTLEGGDILVTERRVFVGESKRTNEVGIRQLAKHLDGPEVRSVRTDLPHLLCACSYLNNNRILLAPELISQESFPGLEIIPVPSDESYAANALYIGEGRVLLPSGFPKTRRQLKEVGYEPLEIDNSEFRKGDGSITCLCSPIYKSL